MTRGARALPDLIPVRMLNEQAYCPRLAYLEWVDADFADSADTVDGRFQHRNVDRETGNLPDPDDEAFEPVHARSISMSAPLAGLIAKMDLVEAEGDLATPVDYKRGRAPRNEEQSWEPERVQLCAQAMVLEENGYRVDRGVLYFVASKQRIEVVFDEELRQRTRTCIDELRINAGAGAPPPPLVESPKCPRCSLVGICLPDEVNLLRGGASDDEPDVRRLVPARDDALPLYVLTAGTKVGRSGGELTVEPREGPRRTVRIVDTSHVSLFGAVQISTQAIQDLCERGVPITYLSAGGWFFGVTRGMDHKNVELRRRQFAVAADPRASLLLARRFVAIKVKNCRTLIRRNMDEAPKDVLRRLKESIETVDTAESLETLLGVEGTAARVYFGAYKDLITSPETGQGGAALFDFEGRNRRPPKDPVNAMLSFGYAMLAKDVTLAILAVGLDPYLGFFHQPRYGRPALALDVMEEFRPLVVDSIVLSAINTGIIQSSDFVRRGGAVALTTSGRSKFLRVYERRMDEEVAHPVFGYRLSYRRTLEVQVRLLARHLLGEIPAYPPFATR